MTRSLSRNVRQVAAAALVALALVFSASCGDSMMQQGDGSSYLIVDLLQAAPGGGDSSNFASTLQSSVSSGADDLGQVTLRMAMKDQTVGVTPTDTNAITITGYHVAYVPNTAGLAVPAAFDAAMTGTITTSATTLTFILVPSQAKLQAPLAGLAGSLFTVANVTFRGHDQAGHAVSVTAGISVTFVQ